MRSIVLLSLALCGTLAGLPAPAQPPERPAKAAAARPQVNLNTATLADLESLPGVGRRTAERIVEYRQRNGGFKRIEELMNIKGIGEKSFLKLRPLVAIPPRADKAPGAR